MGDNCSFIRVANQEFGVVSKHFQCTSRPDTNQQYDNDDFRCEIGADPQSIFPDCPALFNGRDSAIIDYLSIDTLVRARDQEFYDDCARSLALELLCAQPSKQYYRLGVSGAKPAGDEPGGEVVVWDRLNANGAGWSRTHAGAVDHEGNASNSLLRSANTAIMREARIAYAQTAWMRLGESGDNDSFAMRLIAKRAHSLLDAIVDISSRLEIESSAIQLIIPPLETDSVEPPIVVGRILAQIPENPWISLQQPADAGREMRMQLDRHQGVLAFGTYYPRHEPVWESLSNGRRYERRGHFHGSIFSWSRMSDPRLYRTFHLRDLILPIGAMAEIHFTPIPRVFRVHRAMISNCAVISTTSGLELFPARISS